MKFEDALKRLEEIVQILEKQEIGLDESIALFEEGIALKKLCQEKLLSAERKIKIISETEGERLVGKEESLN
ncbi:MAG: exodeoxyribonuclease VII small subunit [bacterium]